MVTASMLLQTLFFVSVTRTLQVGNTFFHGFATIIVSVKIVVLTFALLKQLFLMIIAQIATSLDF